MATIAFEVLNSALKEGIFKLPSLSKHQKNYFNSSVVSFHKILRTLQKSPAGCDKEQLIKKTGLAGNTLSQFLSWGQKQKLIYVEHELSSKSRAKNIYFAKIQKKRKDE